MIRINLFPRKERKRAPRVVALPTAQPERLSVLSVLILVVIFGVIAGFSLNLQKKIKADKAELEKAKKGVEDLKSNIKKIQTDYEEIKRLMDLTANQLEILRALDPPDRLLWSEKMNMLAELIPQGVFLTQIKLTESVTEVPTTESAEKYKEWERGGRKGVAPKLIKKPVIRQTLHLAGVAHAEVPEDRLRLITAFSEALKNFSWKRRDGTIQRFYDHFTGEIGISEIQVVNLEGISVTTFAFILSSKPFGA